MKHFLPFYCALLFIVGSLSLVSCTPKSMGHKQTLKLLVSKQPFDYESPWLTLNPTTMAYYGTVVGDFILTSAEAIKDQTLIEAQPYGSSVKIPLTIKWVDYEANLALLNMHSKLKEFDLKAMPIRDKKPSDSKIIIAKDSQETIAVDATYLNAEVLSAELSQFSSIQLLFETTKKNLGRAEPVVEDGAMVGLAIEQNDNIVRAIPAFMIQHFLNDAHSEGAYKGFAKLGVFYAGLTDPNVKASLGLDPSIQGILAHRIVEGGSAEGLLEVNDVVTHIDGTSINERGEINHKQWGVVHFSTILNEKYSGEKVELSTLRKNKPMKVEIPLKQFDSNAGVAHVIQSPGEKDYRLVGGLIFQELSYGFLKTWGNQWQKIAPLNLLYAFLKNIDQGYTKKRQVILNKVMADSGNKGYEEIKYQLVKSVNGVDVATLEDIDKALANPVKQNEEAFLVVELEEGGGTIVLKHNHIPEIDNRIRLTYNIP